MANDFLCTDDLTSERYEAKICKHAHYIVDPTAVVEKTFAAIGGVFIRLGVLIPLSYESDDRILLKS